MDAVTAYAVDALTRPGEVSFLVRQACQRHLDDVARAGEKRLVWNPAKAQRAIDFFAEVLVLPENTDAEETFDAEAIASAAAPRPFVLQPWQQFIVGSLFGWYTASGFRRFREALIEIAKGSGKTPLCAGCLIYMAVADGERGAQCFVAATTREQAGYGFTDAKRMVEASPELMAIAEITASNIAFPSIGSFIRAISAEKRGLDGKRVHGAMVDELHEGVPVVVQKMRAGTKGRRNAIIFKPTNSGFDRTSVLWQHHEYSRKVLNGDLTDDAWFAFVAGLDPCDECRAAGKWFPSDDCATCDDWKTEGRHWLKANPNLGVSLPWQYVRERVSQAKGMPTAVSDVLRFNFCVWTQGASRAIDMGKWAACLPMPAESELLSADAFGCLDLGETDDLSAWGRLFVLPDGRLAAKFHYWIPSAALERFPNRPYDSWKRLGLLTVTDGDVTNYAFIRAAILEDYKRDGMISVFYDTKTARETSQILMGEGVDMVPMTQGFALNEAIKRMLELIVSGQFCHGHLDPILTWMASNTVVISSSKNEKRLAKERSPEKIDGIAALVMGIEGALVRRERTGEPEYQIQFYGGSNR
jgi:phage terminase large subunit-like protein